MNMSLSRKFFSNVLPSVRSYYSIKVRHSNLTSSYQCLNSLILKAKCQTVFPHKKNTRDFCLRDKIEEDKDAEERIAKEIFTKVNTQLHSEEYGRLFAVIHLCGKQFKVTAEDVIVVQNDLSLETGERIRLEKVLLVGGKDFTLVGRPLLNLQISPDHAENQQY
ncbi:mitochondrial ribosomal protein L21 isoform X2 [Tachypleus tridentatus]|uniref:mitochondrial ribosomal protein L21 isoform X2 n=1 Tax=Tachypleus tridentatus TaxID=6853 RepID=UPI003FD3CF81